MYLETVSKGEEQDPHSIRNTIFSFISLLHWDEENQQAVLLVNEAAINNLVWGHRIFEEGCFYNSENWTFWSPGSDNKSLRKKFPDCFVYEDKRKVNWIIIVPVQHNEAHGFTQGQVALIHRIVDSCLSVLRSGVWNRASKIKLLIHEAILK